LNSGQEVESALLTSQLKGVDRRLVGITEEAASRLGTIQRLLEQQLG
jgi:hypothetical protein